MILFSSNRPTEAFGVLPWSIEKPSAMRLLLVGSDSNTGTMDEEEGEGVSLDSLIDMDVVIYSTEEDSTSIKYLGAVQENGYLSPLSAWTTEPAFGESVEFLVDEDDRFTLVNSKSKIRIHYRLDESELSYGSRQCHRGVGNPHGEESELLYYVEQTVVEKFGIKVNLKPELEILW